VLRELHGHRRASAGHRDDRASRRWPRRRGHEARAYDYLDQPTKIEELEILVRKAAEKGQLVRRQHPAPRPPPGAGPSAASSPAAGRCTTCCGWWSGWRPRSPRCWCSARAHRQGSWSRRGDPRALAARRAAGSCRSTAGAARAKFSRASCAPRRRAPSPAPSTLRPGLIEWARGHAAARRDRRMEADHDRVKLLQRGWRPASSSAVAARRVGWTSAWWPPPNRDLNGGP